MKEYHRNPIVGPGGLHCSCCNPFPCRGTSKRKAKAHLNRRYRRKFKMMFKPEVIAA